jgi:hypothetical protein
VIGHGELGRQPGPVERPELPDVQAQCLGLDGPGQGYYSTVYCGVHKRSF